MLKKQTIFLALFIFSLSLFIQGCDQSSSKNSSKDSSQAASEKSSQASVKSDGKAAPEISAAKWFNTESFSLANNSDKIVVVEFWATWCPPCRQSIPHLKELSENYKDKNVVFVSLKKRN